MPRRFDRIRNVLLGLLLTAMPLVAGCTSKGAPEISDIHGLAVDPSNAARLYVATHTGLWRVENDRTWTGVTKDPFDMMGFTMHPSDASLMYASGHPRMGGLIGFAKSSDGGANWNVIGLKGQVDFHAMTVSLARPETFWGYWKNNVQRSDDGGVQWSVVSKGAAPKIAALASSPGGSDLLYAAGMDGILRSKDGGATFQILYGAAGEASTLATTKGDPNRLVAYFAQGGLMRSKDAGATWTTMNQTFPSDDGAAALAIDPQHSDVVYVGSYRALVRKSVDGGATWMVVR
jgi:hypothetical protein